ncbi:hypothetical protein OC846_003481 [Tilletia horrida]|uniref:Uncharacterized protein n=1 Tax=Tilletia horrida TaxID=155126 RepID=A0AAN6GQ18_9BASI|nr:hypothetical protein OC846_003481 [Tilletia horrida]KAK0567966.1 hypothetical protein OC861_002417 [Tilletia horrida]
MAAPAAIPARAFAQHQPMPTPTKPPAPPGQPLHILLTPQEIADRQRLLAIAAEQDDNAPSGSRQTSSPSSSQEQIVGPFWARSQDDVRRAKLDWDAEQARKRKARPAAGLSSNKVRRQQQQQQQSGSLDALHNQDLVARSRQDDELLEERQTADEERCYVGNAQLSCYPTSNLQVAQGTWSKFIWNSYFPLFIQQGYVDVYLYREDQDRIQTSWTSQRNEAGRLSFSPNDAWWQDRPRAQNIQQGQNISWPFYFVVNPAGLNTGGTTIRQSTWYAIQTAVPAAIASSRSAASASSASAAAMTNAAISSSIASQLSAELQSSLNAEGMTGTQTLVGSLTTVLPGGQTVIITATGRANGTLNGGDGSSTSADVGDAGGSGIPKWAIAVIVILGTLAIVFLASIAYYCTRKARKASGSRGLAGAGGRGSTGSGSPMMRDMGRIGATSASLDGVPSPVGTHSPRALSAAGGPHDSTVGFGSAAEGLAAGAGAGAAAAAAAGAAAAATGTASSKDGDRSGYLPTARSVRSSGDSHLFSSEEASRMADAFRNALRKPEFSAAGGFGPGAEMESPREEEDSPGVEDQGSPLAGAMGGVGNESSPARVAPALLKQELASEGKDLRRVGDRKKAQLHEDEAPPGASAENV